jgi:membrane-bound lytic murein transglycosylase B
MRFRALGFLRVFLVLFCLTIIPDIGWSAESSDPHAVFFEDVQARLLQEGFNEIMLDRLYGKPDVRFDAETVSLFFVHSEARVNYDQFTTWKAVRKARHYIEAHEKELQYAQAKYKVDQEVITAIMLVETQLGTYLGRSHVFNALSTMAALTDRKARDILYRELPPKRRYSRAKFEKKAARKSKWAFNELTAFIHYTAREDMETTRIIGSYAGAMGIAQFMPSNAYALAKDGNSDGRIDLFDHADAIASIAYYLQYHGWKPGISAKKQHRVILHYNNSDVYAKTVLKVAEKLK